MRVMLLSLEGANSSEINPTTAYPVIDLLPEQKDIENLGGTMRLGLYPCKIVPGSLLMQCYNDELVYERHRHRYEFNNEYRERLNLLVCAFQVRHRMADWSKWLSFQVILGSWLCNSIRNSHRVRIVRSRYSVNL